MKGAVLELMAGTGRLSLPRIEAGATLTCVDSSAGMLEVLSTSWPGGGSTRTSVAWTRAVWNCPRTSSSRSSRSSRSWKSSARTRQQKALAAVARCLAPGGRFVCTLHNPEVRRGQVDGTLRVVGQFPGNDGTLVVSGFERGGHPVVEHLQFFELFAPDGRSLWKQFFPMEFAFVEPDAFERMARAAGFRVAHLYGDYARSPSKPARSPVMIWDLQKADA